MASRILEKIIKGRNVLDLPVSEAKKIVAEFYETIEIMTCGFYDPHKMDFFCQRALDRYNLGFLA